jgi:hypothetical protein
MKRYLMLIFLLVALILFVDRVSYAQYTALGIRVGGTTGLTLKHAYRPSMTFEGILGGFGNGFSITGLIEKNTRAFDERGLNWYYGAGAHIAVYNGRNRDYRWREIDDRADNDVGFGINGIIGLEYRLPDNVPIAFSIDLKPFVEVTTDGYAGFSLDPSIGVKFILK